MNAHRPDIALERLPDRVPMRFKIHCVLPSAETAAMFSRARTVSGRIDMVTHFNG